MNSLKQKIFAIILVFIVVSCTTKNNKSNELSESQKKHLETFLNPIFIHSDTDENSTVLTTLKLGNTHLLPITCECENWVGITLTDEDGKSDQGYIKKSYLKISSLLNQNLALLHCVQIVKRHVDFNRLFNELNL